MTTTDLHEAFDLIDAPKLLALRARSDALVAELDAFADAIPSIVSQARDCEAILERLTAEARDRAGAWARRFDEEPDKDLDQAVLTITRVVSGMNRVWDLLGDAADVLHPDSVFVAVKADA